jgi:hypothetical protein
MPNRILYEKICVSDTLAQLTAEEERFFYRLLVQCDDYGRFDGRPSVVRARCFAVQLDAVSDAMVGAWLARLVEVGLLTNYTVDGRPYLQVSTWGNHQQTRAKRSKYPCPPSDVGGSPESASTCKQAPAGAGIGHRYPDPGSEKRETRSGSGKRESRSEKTTPQPPPHAEGEDPPAPRKRGAIRRQRSNGRASIPSDPSEYVSGEYGALVAERMKARLAGGGG